jgi:spore germination protein KA
MFNYIFRKIIYLKMLNESTYAQENENKHIQEYKLTSDLKDNLKLFKDILGASDDIIMRKFSFGNKQKTEAALIYIDGMVDRKTINESILKPFMYDSQLIQGEQPLHVSIEKIESTMLSVGCTKQVNDVTLLVNSCLEGEIILLIDGIDNALIVHAMGWESRGVQEPKTEVVVRGPREGFTETLRSNTALLRRKINDSNFMLETIKIGERTKTNISIAYIKGIANLQIVDEIKRRLEKIKIDAILESGYIEQFIEDNPTSIFATIANSEKPDVIASKILEGRIAILVDGTPMALTVPMLFIESFQSAEDYYSRPYYASFIRILRFISFTISVLAPALYVALTTFRQEIIPTSLLITVAASREGVPYPVVLETFIMIITFEILREAGVRLPRPVGQAVSIVGALVIGEAAVSAGLIGAPTVIVVALTAIATFVVPAQSDSISILRLIFIILAGFMGMFGIIIGLLQVLIHLSSLRSFGVPFLSPISPFTLGDLKDTFVRFPLWKMITRPKTIGFNNLKREEFTLKPEPPREK